MKARKGAARHSAGYLRAHARAVEMCKRLDGCGFRPRVWENMGWHAGIVDSTKCVRVTFHSERTYLAVISKDIAGSLQWVGVGRTARAALLVAAKAARREMLGWSRVDSLLGLLLRNLDAS